MVTKIGIDLGYANVTLSNVIADIFREPSVVLVDNDSRRILSVGAKAVLGSDAEDAKNGILVRPFKNGLLYSSELTREVINSIVSNVKPAENIRCIMGVPDDILPKQESEIFSILKDAGVSECFSVKRSIASLIGAGYAPTISAISVNIGASATEIAVLHKGNIIISTRESIGGEDFDKAIKQYILEQGDMNVSLLVSRTIKERLGAVWQGRENESIDIEGTLSLTGSKVKMSISTEDIVGVFEKPLQKLLLAIANAVKKIPTEAVNDVFENGIILAGGGAELFGLDQMIAKVFGISVTKPRDALDCIAKGLSRIHTFIPVKTKYSGKNITSYIEKLYESKKTQSKK